MGSQFCLPDSLKYFPLALIGALCYQVNVGSRLFFSKKLSHVHIKIPCPGFLFSYNCSNFHVYLIVRKATQILSYL